MKNIMFFAMAAILAIATANAAQLYRWVDDKGNVEWRDTPPPPTAKKVEQRRINPGTASAPDQPYSVQLAMKNFPVTLWTTDCGEVCTRARAHLARRGVPHTEKNPSENIDAFKKATGGSEVPVLEVGNTRIKGYQEVAWDDALDTAGYPKTALVPLKPQPKPAVPASKPAADTTKPADTAAPAPTQPATGAPAVQAPATSAPAPQPATAAAPAAR